MKNTFKVASCNVRGLRNFKKRKIILNTFQKKQIDILCLQETYVVTEDSDKWEKQTNGLFFYVGWY